MFLSLCIHSFHFISSTDGYWFAEQSSLMYLVERFSLISTTVGLMHYSSQVLSFLCSCFLHIIHPDRLTNTRLINCSPYRRTGMEESIHYNIKYYYLWEEMCCFGHVRKWYWRIVCVGKKEEEILLSSIFIFSDCKEQRINAAYDGLHYEFLLVNLKLQIYDLQSLRLYISSNQYSKLGNWFTICT